MKKLLCLFVMSIVAFSLTLVLGCGGQSNQGDEGEQPLFPETINAEFGDMVTFPDIGEKYDIAVTDKNGENIRLQYGSFTPEIGEYNAVCTVNGKSYQIKVICKDTVKPTIKFDRYIINAEEGSITKIPNLFAEDKSGIKSKEIVVTDENGNTVNLIDNSFKAEKGIYNVSATVTDKNGNVSTDKAQIVVHLEYYDNTLTENQLATFNNKDYSNMIYSVDKKDCFQSEIKDGNLVLTTDVEYGNVYSVIKMPVKNFNFSMTGKVFVRVKVDRPTDYIKILADGYLNIAGSIYYPEVGKYYDIEVDPLLLRYGNSKQFTLCARSQGGLTVYVDEVRSTPNKIDANYNGKEDFTGETPLARVFQNIYNCNYLLGNGGFIDGGNSKISLADKYYYGSDTPVKVLQVVVTERNGGFTYMFQKPENIDNVESITIVLSHDDPIKTYRFGVFHDEYRVAGYMGEFSAGKIDERLTLTIPVSDFRDRCNTKLMGIWMGTENRLNNDLTINVESITVNYK